MERIAVAGLSIHDADAARLEALRFAGGDDVELLRTLADALAASELVHISTCNRVEVVFARELGDAPVAADALAIERVLRSERPSSNGANGTTSALRFLSGEAAVRHLFRVASSLDSMVVGEAQILAQVRDAVHRSKDAGLLGGVLDPVFEHALRTGKEVRSRTEIANGSVSVMSLGVDLLLEELGAGSDGRMHAAPRIALVGAGEAARQVSVVLGSRGVRPAYVAHRARPESRGASPRAEALAREFGARTVALDALARGEVEVDAIVGATSAQGYVLSGDALRRIADRSARGIVGLDLAAPRDLEPVDDPRIRIIDLDALRERAEHNRERRATAALEAERIVERRLAALVRRSVTERTAELIDGFLKESEDVLERELTRLRTGRVGVLREADRRAVEEWARSTFGRVCHVPIKAYKRLALERLAWSEMDEDETIG